MFRTGFSAAFLQFISDYHTTVQVGTQFLHTFSIELSQSLEGMDSFFPALAILNAIGTYNAIAFGLALALALGQL